MHDLRNPVELAQALIRCESVTPAEGGALALIEDVLKAAGFEVHRPVFKAEGTPDVENLYARIGTEAPVFLFAGHVDVVPPGDEAAWSHTPFGGDIENDGVSRPRRGRHEGRRGGDDRRHPALIFRRG